MPQIPFIGGAYLARSPNVSADRCINLYPEMVETRTGKAVAALYGTPGLRRWCVLPAGGCRGLYTASSGRAFAVAGSECYELFAGGTFVARGTLATSSVGTVSMRDNGVQLVVVDGTPTGGWVLTFATNAWVQITDPDFYGADRVDFLAGWCVFNRPGTQQLYISGLYDATVFDALDFASAESAPDPLVGLLVERQELWLAGTKSMEVWFVSGGVDFPFAPIQGTKTSYGLAAVHTLRAMDSAVYWLTTNDDGAGMVVRTKGYQPERISTHAVECALQGYARLDDAVAYTEQREGHAFYVLHFPTGNATWAYDAATGLWHERAEIDAATGALVRHRARYHTSAFGLHLVAGDQDGRIYSSEMDAYTNDGDTLVRDRIAPHTSTPELQLLYHSLFQLDMETGVGLDAGAEPGTTPQVMLRWSDDGGHTWGSEHWVSAGAQGQYRARALWRRLGRSRDRVYHVRITAPVNIALLGARIEAH